MHEWAIAEAVIKEVENLIHKNMRLKKIRILAGELQNLDENILKQYMDMMIKEVAPGLKYSIEREEAVFKCNVCGHIWQLRYVKLSEDEREAVHFVPEAIHAYVSCPKCGSRDFTVVRGRGVRLVYEVEEE